MFWRYIALTAKNQKLLQVRDNKLRNYQRKRRNSQFKLLQIRTNDLKIYIVHLIVQKLENTSKQVDNMPQKKVRVKSFGTSD